MALGELQQRHEGDLLLSRRLPELESATTDPRSAPSTALDDTLRHLEFLCNQSLRAPEFDHELLPRRSIHLLGSSGYQVEKWIFELQRHHRFPTRDSEKTPEEAGHDNRRPVALRPRYGVDGGVDVERNGYKRSTTDKTMWCSKSLGALVNNSWQIRQ